MKASDILTKRGLTQYDLDANDEVKVSLGLWTHALGNGQAMVDDYHITRTSCIALDGVPEPSLPGDSVHIPARSSVIRALYRR